MYLTKTLHKENEHNNYLMGLIFSTNWRLGPTKNKKFHMGILIFGILYPKVPDPP